MTATSSPSAIITSGVRSIIKAQRLNMDPSRRSDEAIESVPLATEDCSASRPHDDSLPFTVAQVPCTCDDHPWPAIELNQKLRGLGHVRIVLVKPDDGP